MQQVRTNPIEDARGEKSVGPIKARGAGSWERFYAVKRGSADSEADRFGEMVSKNDHVQFERIVRAKFFPEDALPGGRMEAGKVFEFVRQIGKPFDREISDPRHFEWALWIEVWNYGRFAQRRSNAQVREDMASGKRKAPLNLGGACKNDE
jgi:hypothetical protein